MKFLKTIIFRKNIKYQNNNEIFENFQLSIEVIRCKSLRINQKSSNERKWSTVLLNQNTPKHSGHSYKSRQNIVKVTASSTQLLKICWHSHSVVGKRLLSRRYVCASMDTSKICWCWSRSIPVFVIEWKIDSVDRA